jgi:O-acetyl-ADP-ribose deacetylase (regulator of RNase III)
MINIIASIYCHSVRDKLEVEDYILSSRYQSILFADGADLRRFSAPLAHAKFDAVIAPGNSFGEMSGGFDQGLVDAFGQGLQRNVTAVITKEHAGEMNVGAAVVVETGSDKVPYCAYAPTMRVPRGLPQDTDIPYMATRAGLLELIKSNVNWPNRTINVLIPLMGVGTGGLGIQYVCSQIQLAIGSVLSHHGVIPNLEVGEHYDNVIRGAEPFPPR